MNLKGKLQAAVKKANQKKVASLEKRSDKKMAKAANVISTVGGKEQRLLKKSRDLAGKATKLEMKQWDRETRQQDKAYAKSMKKKRG